MSKTDAYQKISDMVEKEMTMGDIMIADNIFVEYEKGVSIENLAVKYGKKLGKLLGFLNLWEQI